MALLADTNSQRNRLYCGLFSKYVNIVNVFLSAILLPGVQRDYKQINPLYLTDLVHVSQMA